MIEILRLKTPEDIAAEAARRAAEAFAEVQKSSGSATFVAAGGRLPPIAYRVLSEKYSNTFDWSRVIFLIGDERCVPLNDPDSSWLSVLPLLKSHPEIPPENIKRPESNLSAEQAAATYARIIMTLSKNESGLPIFNHLWFGIGEDGHTLSLFPNHPSSTQNTNDLVIPVHDSPKPPPDRISFTYKALTGVESAVTFVSGKSKAPIVKRIADGEHSLPIVIASQTIEKAGGRVAWLVDDEAMSLVPDGQTLDISSLS